MADTVQQGVRCPACRSEIRLQSEILQFKPVYLRQCVVHREMWVAADSRDRRKVRPFAVRIKPDKKKWRLKLKARS